MYAIFFLCYGNDYYLMGLLIVLYCHQYLIKKNNLNDKIKLVVMCDDIIYKYKSYIEIYCDRLIKLPTVTELHEHHTAYDSNKYGKKFMNKIVNKWHCLDYTEYDKILFSDIDILPENDTIYNIFNKYNKPFVFTCRSRIRKCTELVEYDNFPVSPYKDYYDYVENGRYHIDGGFLLVTPDKQLHKEYFDYISTIDFTNKKSVTSEGGFDETSLFYFLIYVKRQSFTCFDKMDQFIIPWKTEYYCDNDINKLKDDIDKKYIINYLSKVKPFIKPLPLMWPEEYVWKIIEKKIITGNKFLKCLSIRNSLYCYSLLAEHKEKSISVVDKNKRHEIYNFTNKLNIKNKYDLFSGQSYNEIINNEDYLLSFKDELNKFNEGIDYINKCCGYIKFDKFKELINS